MDNTHDDEEDKLPVGSRVACIASIDIDAIHSLGYGTYEGLFAPESTLTRDFVGKAPRIRLDNGDVVYGFECYWGPAGSYDEFVQSDGRKVISTSVEELRSHVTDNAVNIGFAEIKVSDDLEEMVKKITDSIVDTVRARSNVSDDELGRLRVRVEAQVRKSIKDAKKMRKLDHRIKLLKKVRTVLLMFILGLLAFLVFRTLLEFIVRTILE